ncbi:hypothetical protein J4217_01910 [Candidatus Pacearchaeota archaeon]|nr:hypothetical protein [Candidatus Pacearchaeota archaeon]
MKNKITLLITSMALLITLIGFASASCVLGAKLVSQDPYPAIPGEYVKLVFQVSGVESPECGMASFELVQKFPFSLDPGTSAINTIKTGTYYSDYKNQWIIPYKVIVNKNALNGNNTLEIGYAYNAGTQNPVSLSKNFDIEVKDTTTDFEVSVKDYDAKTNIITFEILNVGDNDIEALTIDVPVQTNLDIKGSRRNIVGSLDKNDDTTFTFEAIPRAGQISLMISYNDKVNIRHQIKKSVMFNPSDFEGRVKDKKSYTGLVILIIIILAVVGIFWHRRRQKQKKIDHLKRLR